MSSTFLAVEKAEAVGSGLFQSYECKAPRVLTDLNVIYRPLYSMNTFVTNKSKLPQDGAHVFSYMG